MMGDWVTINEVCSIIIIETYNVKNWEPMVVERYGVPVDWR